MLEMKNFKFVGGPLDGGYHEAAENVTHVDAVEPALFKFDPHDAEKYAPTKYTRYTLRTFGEFPHCIFCYAVADWSDVYVLSQLLHHYKGRGE
jgi:hypothetical protein